MDIGEIRTDHMTLPRSEKLHYYENFYKTTGKLVHPIVIDEENRLRDGYISYLLARKYGEQIDILKVTSRQSIAKIVIGRHVYRVDGEYRIKCNKYYRWLYDLGHAVVPGDILRVETKKGKAYMCVEKIDYLIGKECYSQHARALKHMENKI